MADIIDIIGKRIEDLEKQKAETDWAVDTESMLDLGSRISELRWILSEVFNSKGARVDND